MKYQLIVFDLDGTLLNTIGDLADSVNYALQYLHLPPRTTEEVLSFVGNGNRRLMERSVSPVTDPETIQTAFEKFHEYYRQHYTDKTFPYAGIQETLQELKSSGYQLAVVSNKADYAVEDLCRLYFGGIFDFVLGDKDGIRRKPDAEPVHLAMKALGAQADQTIYIGDSEVDIKTACNAGVDSLIVDWGFRSHDALEKAGANAIISRPEEILSFI